jgi:hypothetical protein
MNLLRDCGTRAAFLRTNHNKGACDAAIAGAITSADFKNHIAQA